MSSHSRAGPLYPPDWLKPRETEPFPAFDPTYRDYLFVPEDSELYTRIDMDSIDKSFGG